MKSTNAEARLAIKQFKDSIRKEHKHKFKLGDSYELDMSKFEDAVEGKKYGQDYVKELSASLNKVFGDKTVWLTDWEKLSDESSKLDGYVIVKMKVDKDPDAKNFGNAKQMAQEDKELVEGWLTKTLPSDISFKITAVQERPRVTEGWSKENRVIDFSLTLPTGQWSASKPEAKYVNVDEYYIMKALYGTKDSLSEEDHDAFEHELFHAMKPVLKKYSAKNMSLGDIKIACEFIISHLDGAEIKLVEDAKSNDADISKGEQIAKVIAEALKGECGPVSGEDPKLDGNKVGLYSQMPTEWFRFNDDGSVDSVNLKELLEKYPSDYGVEDKEDIDAMVEEYGHFASVKDLLNSDLSWFMYLENEKEILDKVEKILKGSAKDSLEDDEDELRELMSLIGQAHDKYIEAQDLISSLSSNSNIDSSELAEVVDECESSLSKFDTAGDYQEFLEKLDLGYYDEDSEEDEEDW